MGYDIFIHHPNPCYDYELIMIVHENSIHSREAHSPLPLYIICYYLQNATAENLMDFFSAAGDVRFVRMAGDETQPTRFAFVEFATVKDVQAAIRMSGQVFAGRLIK